MYLFASLYVTVAYILLRFLTVNKLKIIIPKKAQTKMKLKQMKKHSFAYKFFLFHYFDILTSCNIKKRQKVTLKFFVLYNLLHTTVSTFLVLSCLIHFDFGVNYLLIVIAIIQIIQTFLLVITPNE